jgi:hypothetical protein
MSAETQGQTAIPSDNEATEPRPWRTPADVNGWQGRGRVHTPGGQLPRITAVVDLDSEQSDWVRQEARRAGVSPVQFLKRLVDAARATAQVELSAASPSPDAAPRS